MGDEWLVYWSTGKLVAHIKEQRTEIAALKKHLIEAQERHRYELARADVLDRENNHAQAENDELRDELTQSRYDVGQQVQATSTLKAELEGWEHKVDDLIKQTDIVEEMLKDEANGWQLECFAERRKVKEQQADIERLRSQGDFTRVVYLSELLAEKDADIERLKEEHMRKMVRVTDDCARALAALNDRANFHLSRAQAWRRCAREWRVSMVIGVFDDKDGLKRRLKTKFHIQRLRRDINKTSKKYSLPNTEKEGSQ